MAGNPDDVITRLATTGLPQYLSDFQKADQARNQHIQAIESTGVRQRTVYDSTARAAEDAAKRQAEAAQKIAEASKVTTAALERDAQRAAAAQRIMTGPATTTAQVRGNDPRNNTARVDFLANQRFALANPNLNAQFALFEEQQRKLETSTRRTSRATNEQAQIFGSSSAKGITYLSTLSAIHAASFLLGSQTFTNVGSLTVLGAAFSKLGPAASVAGVGFGAALLGVNTFVTAAEQAAQVINTLIVSLATLGVTATTALVALGVQGTRAAADVEQRFALLRGLTNSTIPQLILTEEAVRDLGIEFGVSASKVTDAASLFVRAGGSIEQANEGATRAILALQVASGGELAAAEAARAVAVAIAQFKDQAVTAEQAVNVLTATAQKSALTFTEVSQAFQQAVPGGQQLGFTIEELGAVVGVLGNRLRGTVAGTAFKQFLLDLVNPSDKAKAAFESVGLSANFIFDAMGKARPVIDIITDLSTALAGVSQQKRSEALAQIFESRAGLAGNILSLESIREEYQEMLEAMSDTSAADVAARVLNTVDKQAARLAVTVENLGIAFGGPLLGPVKQAGSSLVDFFKNLTPQAQLAGQMVGVVLGGEGFGALQQKIQDVTSDPAASTFLTRLVDLGLQLRSHLVEEIVPALGQFASSLLGIANESGRVEDIDEVFDRLSKTVSNLSAGATVLIGRLSGLVQEFVNNEGAGGRLRTILEAIADSVKNNLIRSLVSLAPTIVLGVAAFVAMSKAGRALLETFVRIGPVIGAVVTHIGKVLDQFGQSVGSFVEDTLLIARAQRSISKTILGQIDLNELGELKDDIIERLARPIPARPEGGLIQSIGSAISEGTKQAGELIAQLDSVGATVDSELRGLSRVQVTPFDIQDQEEQIARVRQRIADLKQDITGFEGLDLEDQQDQRARDIAVLEDQLTGLEAYLVDMQRRLARQQGNWLPNFFDNLGEEIAEAQDRAAKGTTRGGTQAGPPEAGLIDHSKVEKALQQVDELGRDLATKLANINEDTKERTSTIIQNGLDKIEDLFDKADDKIQELADSTRKRIEELDRALQERRDERTLVQGFQKAQEAEARGMERFFEDMNTLSERNLETRRIQRQRDTDEEQRALDKKIDANERANKRVVEDQERSFQRAQAAQERTLSATQDKETKLLERQLEDQATARKNAQELGEAKTPKEREEIVRRQNLARADTVFARGQQAQLEALRKKQEEARLKAQQAAENAQLAFRRQIEQVELAQREANEATLLRFRRGIEDRERATRIAEENTETQRRRTNEETLRGFREEQEQKFQNFRDKLEDDALARQKQRILEEARTRETEILGDATTQADRARRELEQQLTQQQVSTLKTLRNEQQRIIDRIDDIQRTIPGVPLSEISQLLGAAQAGVDREVAAGEQRLQAALDQVDARRQDRQAQLRGLAQFQPVETTPAQAVIAGAKIAAQIILPPNFVDMSARAFEIALIRYGAARGEGGGDINIDGNVVDQGDFFSQLAQFGFELTRSRR